MTDYTPKDFEPFTDEEMREIFLDRDLEEWAKLNPQHRNASGEDWDQWLEEHDRQVAEKAWHEGRSGGLYDGRARNNVTFLDRLNPYLKAES